VSQSECNESGLRGKIRERDQQREDMCSELRSLMETLMHAIGVDVTALQSPADDLGTNQISAGTNTDELNGTNQISAGDIRAGTNTDKLHVHQSSDAAREISDGMRKDRNSGGKIVQWDTGATNVDQNNAGMHAGKSADGSHMQHENQDDVHTKDAGREICDSATRDNHVHVNHGGSEDHGSEDNASDDNASAASKALGKYTAASDDLTDMTDAAAATRASSALKQLLQSSKNDVDEVRHALEASRQSTIDFNLRHEGKCARMGSALQFSAYQQYDVVLVLHLWREWKESLMFEATVNATDEAMKAANSACMCGLESVLCIVESDMSRDDDNKQDCDHVTADTELVRHAFIAAGQAMDKEMFLYETDHVSMVPLTPLLRAAENVLASATAQQVALERACAVYDTMRTLHNAEARFLHVSSVECQRKEQAVTAVQTASKAHKLALAKLKREQVLEQNPELAEVEGLSMEQVRASVRDKRNALKESSRALNCAVSRLLEIQQHFPEAAAYIKAGLPLELVAVWRPDLTLDMFDDRNMIVTDSKHTVFKAHMGGRAYALKEYKMSSEFDLRLLLREAAFLRRLRHPAIVDILGVCIYVHAYTVYIYIYVCVYVFVLT
jgi:hypothetical protein